MSHPANATGHAFLSYDPEDASQVDRLQRVLENAGISVWRDTANLWPGEDWQLRIRQAIAGDALAFIACFSRTSTGRVKSTQNEQLLLAIEQLRLRQPGAVWLIPVRFDNCAIPDWDLGAGHTLRSLYPVDLFGDRFDAGTTQLIAAIKRILGTGESLAPPSSHRAQPETRQETRPAAGPEPVTIEVAIEPAGDPGKFKVDVLRSAAGEATALVELDLDTLAVRNEALSEILPLAALNTGRPGQEAGRFVRVIGEKLFAALLGTEPVAGVYRANVAIAADRGRILQVVVRTEVPELARLPWETMYDQLRGAYLARQDQLIRNIPIATVAAPLQVRPPLRILGIACTPPELPSVRAIRERNLLAEAVAEPVRDGLIEVQWAPAATWNNVHDLMLSGEWHVVHFVGHGGSSSASGEGVLVMNREDGQADRVEASRFTDLLRQARPMPRLVVLNSCPGAAGADGGLFSDTAPALVRGGATAVVAMQYEITNPAAIAFARAFYTAIARGRGVDEAVSSGRIGILGRGSETLEWITPVLYLRNNQTRLFDRTT
jgi:hypothetical protein